MAKLKEGKQKMIEILKAIGYAALFVLQQLWQLIYHIAIYIWELIQR